MDILLRRSHLARLDTAAEYHPQILPWFARRRTEEMADDKEDDEVKRLSPKKFACPTTAYEFQEEFNTYVELRVIGTPRDIALIEAFDMIGQNIDLTNIRQLAMATDVNPYVRLHFKKVLATKDIKRDMWSERMAANKLLELINDDSIRDSTRLNAITALNVLCGYIQLDEATSRRVGHTLADFARMNSDHAGIDGGMDEPDSRSVH